MNSLLAIETSGAYCSVCLRHDGNRFSATEHVEKKHNEKLLPMLNSVCRRAGIDQGRLIDSLEAVAFGCGPGSFTGVSMIEPDWLAIRASTTGCKSSRERPVDSESS